jgi:hypothetical protein
MVSPDMRGAENDDAEDRAGRPHSAAKAERILAWRPRPVSEIIIDCAHGLAAAGALS